jgi:hypothetical protein
MRKKFINIASYLLLGLSFYLQASGFDLPLSPYAYEGNLAYNPNSYGFPCANETDDYLLIEGAKKWSIIDGHRMIDEDIALENYRNFTDYEQYCCFWKHAVVDFGRTVSLNRVFIMFGGIDMDERSFYKLEYLDPDTEEWIKFFESERDGDTNTDIRIRNDWLQDTRDEFDDVDDKLFKGTHIFEKILNESVRACKIRVSFW